MTSYSEEEILSQLDWCHARSEFPALGNTNIDYVSGRLMGFRDDERWALVFNWIVWWPAVEGAHAMVECFGNCIKGKLGFDEGLFSPGCLIYSEDSEENRKNEEVVGASIRGQSVDLSELGRGSETPAALGEDFRVLVDLADKYKESLLASREEYGKFIPDDLPQVISLDEWLHSDWDMPPSQTETFRLLAKVLVTGEASHYRPTLKPNTDWREWVPK